MPWKVLNILVLYIEDSPADRDLIGRLLYESKSFSMAVASTATLTSALNVLRGVGPAFDILLLDLSLPDADGESAVATLHQEFPHLPIITLADAVDPEQVSRCYALGAAGYLHKRKGLEAVDLDNAILGAIHKPSKPPVIPPESKKTVAVVAGIGGAIQLIIYAILEYLK